MLSPRTRLIVGLRPPEKTHLRWCEHGHPSKARFLSGAVYILQENDQKLWWLVLVCALSSRVSSVVICAGDAAGSAFSSASVIIAAVSGNSA